MVDNVTFCYRGSWTAEGANTAWEASWRLVGENGTIVWDGSNPRFAEVVDSNTGFMRHTRRVESKLSPLRLTGHAGCLDDMVRALHESRHPMTWASDNIKSLALVLCAVENANLATKIPIKI